MLAHRDIDWASQLDVLRLRSLYDDRTQDLTFLNLVVFGLKSVEVINTHLLSVKVALEVPCHLLHGRLLKYLNG